MSWVRDGQGASRLSGAQLAWPVTFTLAIQTAVAVAVYSTPVMAPVAARALDVEPSSIGFFIAVAYLGSMFGSVSAGGWVARFGPIRVSQLGLVLCFVGLALGATAWLPTVLLGAFFIGLGYGPATPASSQILARATPSSLVSLIFSIKQTGVPAGAAIAGALVPVMVLTLGWRASALWIGAACVVLALAIQPVRATWDRDLDPRAPINLRSALAPVGFVLRDPKLGEMALVSFAYAGVQITLTTFLVTFLTQALDLSLVLAGLVMATSQIASVVGRVVWGVVADRKVARRTMLGWLGLGMGASAVVMLWAGPGWSTAVLLVYAAIFGATAVGWNGVYLAEVARIAPPGQAGAATGGCLFFTFLGVVIAPPVFNGLLAWSGSYTVAYAAFGAPALLIGAQLLRRR